MSAGFETLISAIAGFTLTSKQLAMMACKSFDAETRALVAAKPTLELVPVLIILVAELLLVLIR